MLLPQFIRDGAAALEALYPPQEARSLVLRLCEDLCGIPPFEYIVRPETEVPEVLQDGLRRLLSGEPLQHITGWQEFRGRRFRVTPDVLIPRPETEMLVALAVAQLQQEGQVPPESVSTLGRVRGRGPQAERSGRDERSEDSGGTCPSCCYAPRVLDLCTGSGCIAWSIALEVPGAQVTGVDISDTALNVARSQFSAASGGQGPALLGRSEARTDVAGPASGAAGGKAAPRFVKADVLEVPEEFEGAPYDVITANPPYIRESEKGRMHRNVLEHEPELALFVPDEDPLLFYHAVAQWAQRFLKPGGWGIVEINEDLGDETAALFVAAGLKNVKKEADYFGRDRFVVFEKAGSDSAEGGSGK